ncbi:MAG: site-specific integrase [Flavobacteriales bacterium]|nr:site-specific integrase [Flavobacteriales bacterium]
MALKVNFNLKDSKSKTPTSILLVFVINKKRFKLYTEEKIKPNLWDKEKQRVKSGASGRAEINDELDKLEERIKEIDRKGRKVGAEMTVDYFKQSLNSIPDTINTKIKFFAVFDKYLHFLEVNNSPTTVRKFLTLKNRLESFKNNIYPALSFQTIDQIFHDQFIEYLATQHNCFNNTLGKYISDFKTFMAWAYKRNYTTNTKFQDFKCPKHETNIITLTLKEVIKLHDLSLDSDRLRNVRDSFCFCCYTGLRFSDVKKLKHDDVKNDQISIWVEKTKNYLTVELNPLANEILERNDFKKGGFLKMPSGQKFNQYLKEIGKIAEFNSMHKIIQLKGSKKTENSYPLHELMSSHMARRSFISNLIEEGAPSWAIMAQTGHVSEKSFKKYIDIRKDFKKAEMNRVFTR